MTSFFALAPVTIGIVTIFGRKGKKEEEKPDKAPTQMQPTSPSPAIPAPPQNQAKGSSPTSSNEQSSNELESKSPETSLSQLLHSLLEDVPLNEPPSNETDSTEHETMTEWVPPLASPPSRKMVVVESDKGEKILAPTQSNESEPYSFSSFSEPDREREEFKPEPSTKEFRKETVKEIAKPPSKPTPPPKANTTEVDPIKASKVEKLEKPEKIEPKQKTPTQGPPTKMELGPDHLFDLTSGGLDSPGLVLITGSQGSGKTSVVLALTGKYLAAGADCLLISYDQSVSSLRETMKSASLDASKYESQFHLLIFDAFSGQTDSLSFEPYSIEKPFDIENMTETLVRNAQMMIGGKTRILVDSITELTSHTPSKDLPSKFRTLSDKMRENGSTLIVTLDPTKLSKDIVASLEDLANCVIELQGDAQKGGQLRVKKLNGTLSKLKPEDFEIQRGKGLLFT